MYDNDDDITNKSNNRPFADILRARTTRRQALAGGLVAASVFLAPASVLAHKRPYRHEHGGKGGGRQLINFRPVPVAAGTGPQPAVSDDYEYDVLIPWGSPLEPGGPEYNGDPDTRPTAAEQAEMIGIGHDGMWFFPARRRRGRGRAPVLSSRHGMLCVNHEFGRNSHVLGKDEPESLEDVRLSQHAHGVSVVAIARWRGQWRQVRGKSSRRIHVNTPMAFSGPAAGHELLSTPNGNVPLGTVNNCASGYTPWGTYLTCEENFNGYFGATSDVGSWTATPEQDRYGFTETGFRYGWEKFDRRFNLADADYKNEENRFGWVVEIDPWDATQTPVKRTALGRFKHEGAAVTEGKDGRVVVYMGDDQRFDYIYKFVSSGNWRAMRRSGKSPLDEGTLYVARFNEDGSGDWLPLTMDDPKLAGRFQDQAELLVYARVAADIVGATPMDRPEWATVAPNGDVYCTLTNNSDREEANAANPLAPNADGHIIRWRDANDHVGITFNWDIFLIAETTHGTEDTFSDPDGLWADPDGRLFIETDGGQKDDLNNQMLVADPETGELRRLLTGVTEDEITGIAVTPDRRTLFCNSQHPGDGDPSITNFPAATDGYTIPRDATIVLRRKDRGIVGS